MSEAPARPIIRDLVYVLPVLTAVGGGLWGAFVYIEQQRSAQEQAAHAAESAARTRLLEAQQPFLTRQLDLYFETSEVLGRLVMLTPGTPEFDEAESRFWALYWSELSMVESSGVERAMKACGDALTAYLRDPARKSAFQSSVYVVAHAIRDAIKESWGASAGSSSEPAGAE